MIQKAEEQRDKATVFQAGARMRNCLKHVALLHLLTTMVVPLLSPSGSWFFSDL